MDTSNTTIISLAAAGMASATSINTKRVPCVRKGHGPDDLVGLPYKALTPPQKTRLLLWRVGHSCCQQCGAYRHLHMTCPKLKKVMAIREERSQCLYCGSHTHVRKCERRESVGDCPLERALEESVGDRGDRPLVPKELDGVAFLTYTAWEKKYRRSYLVEEGYCLFCMEIHPWHSCPKRLIHVNKIYKAKLRAYNSGQLTINTTFDCALGQLPYELRMKIFNLAFTRDAKPGRVQSPVVVRPGYIPSQMRRAGLPLKETLECWLKNNIFRIDSAEAMQHFTRFVTSYNMTECVRVVQCTDAFASCSPYGEFWFPKLEPFLKLKKMIIPAPSSRICDWDYETWIPYTEQVPRFLEAQKFETLSTYSLKNLKGLLFQGYHSSGSSHYMRGDFEHPLLLLEEMVRNVLRKCGRSDIYVAAVESGHGDDEWENI